MPKIVITGTKENIDIAEEYFEGIYSEISSFVTIPLIFLFPDRVFKELQIKVGEKHNVDLQ